jgi:uncharacterized protein YciI
MKRSFAVIRSRGPEWNASRSIEGQREWLGHAMFIDGLEAEGFVLLAGPLEGTSEVLLVVQAESEAEIRERFAADPWTGRELSSSMRVHPWTLRLGSLGQESGGSGST